MDKQQAICLDGCKTTPLSSYLKALGLLRILSKEEQVTASWENDRFVLRTSMSVDTIADYLLTKYNPTPIIGPWSYNKYESAKENLLQIIESDRNRFKAYDETLAKMNEILTEIGIPAGKEDAKKVIDKNKTMLLKMCRNHLPDCVVPWIDAVGIIEKDKPRYAPILGSGGNDGNFDMSENFAKNLKNMLIGDDKNSRMLARTALTGQESRLENITMMGHNPNGGGGPNYGNGFSGKSLSNPWEYILMMEGIVLFAGSITRRKSASTGKASFPFSSNASNVGYHTATIDDTDDGSEPQSKGEIWAPVWDQPATYDEILHLFGEGRVQFGRRSAQTGVEFARAIITMGTDKGISKFQRFCMLKRKGKAYMTIGAGSFDVTNDQNADLLSELDEWIDQFAKKIRVEKQSGSLKRLKRSLDASMIKYCSNRKKPQLLQILINVGRLERYASQQVELRPLQKLTRKWLAECNDGSAEFRLAASIASIQGHSSVGSIRVNIEYVKREVEWKRDKNSIYCVWKEDDTLIRNMERVLQRRFLDGKMSSHKTMPIHGTIPAQVGDIVQFLNGELDESKIRDLVLPLSIIENEYTSEDRSEADDRSKQIPEIYAIIKLLYPSNEGECIPNEASVLNMLHAGRHYDAFNKAKYMLRAHGMIPENYSRGTSNKKTTTIADSVKKRLLASILFPISMKDRKKLICTVIRQPEFEN